MKRKSRILPSSLALAVSLAATGGVYAEELLEEILVTVQKRTQSITDIPMSVTVLGGEDLERQQAHNFQDMMALIPGLSTTSSQPGASRITLRGINSGGIAATVGVYMGDVPFGSSTGLANGGVVSGDFDTFDMARVEVLRGPQGTLYGASSLGGVLKYVPNAPSTEALEVKVQTSIESVKDGDLGHAITGVVNIPINDKLAVRASAFSRYDDGFIDSIGNNPVTDYLDPSVNVIDGTQKAKGLNDLESNGGRLSALFLPTDNLSLTFTAMQQNIDSGAPDLVDADATTLKQLHNSPVQSRYQDAFSDFEYDIYSLDMKWDLGAFTLESITSDSSFEQTYQQDAAIASNFAGIPLSAFLSLPADFGGLGMPVSAVLPQVTLTDKFTQEFRLISPNNERFEWLLGAFYTKEESQVDQQILAVNPGTETPVAGLPKLAELSLFSEYEELAFFANATWYISPSFELSLGARYSDNEQTGRQVSSGPLAGDSDFAVDSDETPVTWSLTPRFILSEQSSAYIRVATGFRPGGPNVVPGFAPDSVPRSYDADELTSYEIGFKTTSEDGSFGLDIAAYYLDWQDLQLLVNVDGFGANVNGGTAESKGLELTASYYPMAGLSFAFSGAYTDASLTEDLDPSVGGFDGDPLPFVPEWTGTFSTDYQWVMGGGMEAYVGASLVYTDSRPAGFDNRDAAGKIREADDYTLLNVRAGVEWDNWSLEFYGKNLTDEEGITSIESTDAAVTGRVELGIIRPRTLGLSIGYKM